MTDEELLGRPELLRVVAGTAGASLAGTATTGTAAASADLATVDGSLLDGTPSRGGLGYFVWRNGDDYTIEIQGQAFSGSDPNHVARYTVTTDGTFTNVDTTRFGALDSLSHTDTEISGQNEVGFGEDILTFTFTAEDASRLTFDLGFGETQYSIDEFDTLSLDEKQSVVDSTSVASDPTLVHLGSNETHPPSAHFEITFGPNFPPVQELPSDIEVDFDITGSSDICNFNGADLALFGNKECNTQPDGQTPVLWWSDISLACQAIISFEIEELDVNLDPEIDLVNAWIGIDPVTLCVWVGEEQTGQCAKFCSEFNQPSPVTYPQIESVAQQATEWIDNNTTKENFDRRVLKLVLLLSLMGTASVAGLSFGSRLGQIASRLGISI